MTIAVSDARAERSFGPWAPGIPEGERLARVREMRALASLICGYDHPLVTALHAAQDDLDAAARAQLLFDNLPALRLRRLLASYAELHRPPRRERSATGALR